MGRFACASILRDVEAETVLGNEERIDGPLAAVSLMPDAPSVLQLHKRLKIPWAFVAST